ncbi:MAG: hypothetical protein OHK005_18150 [Candidatus Methylacidiphilales bacterium]
MFPIPSPLHPAIVHFPIVLILIGAALALAAVFLRRWNLPTIAAVCLSLGAFGSLAATLTGEQEEEMVGELVPAAERMLDEHEEWAELTRNLAIVAAVISIAAALMGRFPFVARMSGAVAALVALAAAFAVAQTGHHGGQLVYRFGVGVHSMTGNTVPREAGEVQTTPNNVGMVEKKKEAEHEHDHD